jgi:ribonuclease P protein component
MLTKSHRFHGYSSLLPVYRHSQNVRGSLMALKFSHRDNQKQYRVAVVVSRKVNKSAVVRNRIRRRIFEAVRQSKLDIPSGLDLIFIIFNDQIADVPATKLQDTVGGLLQKAVNS